MPDPAKLYEGGACHRCGGTLRWKCNRHCVECSATFAAERKREYRKDPDYCAREEAQGAEYHLRMYHGTGNKSFLYRASRAMRSRRHAALERVAQRQEA